LTGGGTHFVRLHAQISKQQLEKYLRSINVP
jgi:hypothetical protein